MTLEIYTLDEAARAMVLHDPQAQLSVPDARLPKIVRALARIVDDIGEERLTTEPLAPSIQTDRTMLTDAYLDALASPDDGGPAIQLSSREKDQLRGLGIRQKSLEDFARRHHYTAPSFPNAAARQLAQQRYDQADVPYEDAVSDAVQIWQSGDERKHNKMRNFLIAKPDYHDLDPEKLLRKLKDAANSHGFRHLVFGTNEQRIHARQSDF